MIRKFLFVFSLLIFLFTANSVFAEQINSFDVEVVARKDGGMQVTEIINYDFESASRHGIYRYIPLYSRVGGLYRIINLDNINVDRDGEKEKFSKSQNKEQIYLKIGDPDKTITGEHNYLIRYNVKNAVGSNFPEYDEIYWNGTGNGWDVPIKNASIKITNDFGIQANRFLCFTGFLNSTESNCAVENGIVISSSTLNPNEGLTAVAVYPKDTFPPSTLSKNPPETFADKIFGFIFDNFIFIWLALNILLVGLIIYWYQRHKNKKRFGKPTVNFDIPKDDKGERITPALAGIIDSAKLEQDDVVATLFDLAIRRYIKIEEVKEVRKFIPDESRVKIRRLKTSEGLNTFEKTLYNRLFISGKDNVFIKDLKKDFYKTFNKLEENAFDELVKKKYFTKNPKAQRAGLVVLAFIALFTTNIILAGALFYLSRKLIGRTQLGDEIDFRIDGLKVFLKSMNRNYKWQAEKFYTVEQMIPFAMSLGYIDKFMEQLKIIKPDYNPTWYSGYRGGFYVAYGALNSSLSSNITTASPSSSGAGGGGFSGGGGGGGGGGSW